MMMNFSEALYLLQQKRAIKRKCWGRQKVMLDNGEFYYITPLGVDQMERVPSKWLLATDWIESGKERD